MKTLPLALLALLSAAPSLAQQNCAARPILCNEVIAGELAAGDCQLSDNRLVDRFLVSVQPDQHLSVAAVSNAFRLSLAVTEGDRSVGTATAPQSATATVADASLGWRPWEAAVSSDPAAGRQLGAYQVKLVCETQPPCPVVSVSTACPNNLSTGGRYRAQASWENPANGRSGVAKSHILNSSASLFGFEGGGFDLLLKVLPVGDRVQVLYSPLSDLNFKLAVTDLATDTTKLYAGGGESCASIDNRAFRKAVDAAAIKPARCRNDKFTRCLLNDRFAVQVDWVDPHTGKRGHAMGITALGFFYFQEPSNYEVFVELKDLGNHVGISYGALTNLGYTIRVTDTLVGRVKTYRNPPGRFCGGIDNNPFGAAR